MKNLKLYLPKINELNFAKNLLNDPATMAYNRGYNLPFPGYDKETGTITHDQAYWKKWYELYFSNPSEYFYAYIYDKDLKSFVGDVNFHPSRLNDFTRDIGIVIKDEFRGQGYGKLGLKLLVNKAFSYDSIRALANNFEKERVFALKIHKELGFKPIENNNKIIDLLLKKIRVQVLACTLIFLHIHDFHLV